MTNRVPSSAQAIVDLINSRPHAIHADRLDDQAHAERILGQFAPETAPASVDSARRIRADLVAIIAGDDAGWRDFTEHTSEVVFRHDFTGADELARRQAAGDPVVGGITLAVADLVSSGNWSRVRICANPNCEGAFYDTTRSRTQRWDSYDTCGNRNNVAAYRARQSKR